jgi:hypothetical protein
MKNNNTLDVVRSLLIAGGAIATSLGYLNQGQVVEITGAVAILAGAFGEVITRIKLKKQNNKTLQDLKDLGVYNGKMDGVVGPVARAAITVLADKE